MRVISLPVLLVSLVTGLGGCAVWSPGEDPNGRRVIAKGDRVLEAMAAYSRARGQYPKTLMSLYPDYLQEERTVNFHLVADPGGDRLVVLYPPSWPVLGLVECSSEVRARKWKCQRSPLVP